LPVTPGAISPQLFGLFARKVRTILMMNELRETHIALSGYIHDISSRLRNERGAALVEYSLLVALLALVAFAAIAGFGATVGQDFSEINSDLVRGVENNPQTN